MTPLNASLYQRLRRSFGHVRVSNVGEAFSAKAVHGMEGEPALLISHAGEYYQVCCPYCHDTRFRLYVNHMYMQTDEHGRRMTFMAICYNEGCLNNPENRHDFIYRLDDTGEFLSSVEVARGRVVADEAREVMWPGPCKLLSELRDQHPAREYLLSRQFDPDKIARQYGVQFCLDSHYFLARERIIIPIYEKDKLKGWQARYVGELPWKDRTRRQGLPPKYFSCPDSHFRSRCIYNFDRMRNYKTGIIMEGPTDVWSFGFMAGCIFGNTMTEQQRRKFLAVFRKRTAILMLDPEEFQSRSTQRLIDTLAHAMPKHFAAIKLPDDTDPGSLDRDFMRDFVHDEAKKQGVIVSYKKVKAA